MEPSFVQKVTYYMTKLNAVKFDRGGQLVSVWKCSCFLFFSPFKLSSLDLTHVIIILAVVIETSDCSWQYFLPYLLVCGQCGAYNDTKEQSYYLSQLS